MSVYLPDRASAIEALTYRLSSQCPSHSPPLRCAGFPGSLHVSVTYSVEQPHSLAVRMSARVEGNGRATPVSLAHHM